MSGRHRKPTQPSINVAKIAFTGAVIGGSSLAFSAQAAAATDGEWDQVAHCESGNNWSINTGNGYQGGLQFSPSTWMSNGGGEFAPAAHLASRDQQIAIAERVLAGQGRRAWPVCGTGLSGPTPRQVAPTSNDTQTLDAPDLNGGLPAPDAPPPGDPGPPAPADGIVFDASLDAPAPDAPPPVDAPPADAPAPDAPAPGDEAVFTETSLQVPEQDPAPEYTSALWSAIQGQDITMNDAIAGLAPDAQPAQ